MPRKIELERELEKLKGKMEEVHFMLGEALGLDEDEEAEEEEYDDDEDEDH